MDNQKWQPLLRLCRTVFQFCCGRVSHQWNLNRAQAVEVILGANVGMTLTEQAEWDMQKPHTPKHGGTAKCNFYYIFV